MKHRLPALKAAQPYMKLDALGSGTQSL
jgi:hypothetical protein